MYNNEYAHILYELLLHKADCKCCYEKDCKMFGEDHDITKNSAKHLKDAEKAIEFFEKIIDREGQP